MSSMDSLNSLEQGSAGNNEAQTGEKPGDVEGKAVDYSQGASEVVSCFCSMQHQYSSS
jgi:hypothetical protein